MERIYSDELAEHVGERVRLAGWLHRLRRLSRVSFLILRDARGLAQVVLEDARELAADRRPATRSRCVAVEGVSSSSDRRRRRRRDPRAGRSR